MKETKIGILEDDGIIALTLQRYLGELGYEPTEIATTYEEAEEMVKQEKPDLMLIDIQLRHDIQDGIAFATYLKGNHDIPFIFVTANGDADTLERAKPTQPAAFLMKPFTKTDIHTAIEVALYNFSERTNGVLRSRSKEAAAFASLANQYRLGNAIFVKSGASYHKVPYTDIIYLEMDNQHLYIHTTTRKMATRQSLGSYMEFLNDGTFLRVHRGYAVNIEYIKSLESEFLIVENHKIPIGKTYRQEILNYLRIF